MNRKKLPAAGQAKAVKGADANNEYQLLRDRIASLELLPGEDIDEQALVEELGISGPPLRTVMIRLAAEGLISLLPGRGAWVASMDIPQLQEHLEAFELAHRATLRLAAQRRSGTDLKHIEDRVAAFEQAYANDDVNGMIDGRRDLHLAIGNACGNRVLAGIYAKLLEENLRVARLAMSHGSFPSAQARHSHLNGILREHREFLDAIRKEDADRAENLACSHIGRVRKRVAEYVSQRAVAGVSISSRSTRALNGLLGDEPFTERFQK
ncbi:GntR family transcriptional regulator [Paraburkholderia sp. J76]|uniref:GntR family transcriptional regulator n=1 Tax=Paraburkholderia sp. J76 TaxID=2805439 RepID=UPI002ABE55E3|nr:GntR family transcriptional regulator [Paraburkholderia sp. J76]